MTLVGIKGRCTVTAYGRPTGSSGETSFGSLTVDVVPGSDQTVDIGGPTLTVLSPSANTAFTTSPITVTGKATDDTQVSQVTVNGVATTLTSTSNASDPKEVSFSATVDLNAGPNVIKTIATDSSGKSTSDTRTVYLDDQDPTVTWTPADGASATEGTVVVSGTATDNIGVATISVNGAVVYSTSGTPQTSVTFSKSLTLAAGTHDVVVVVTDLGGRSISQTHRITLSSNDTTPPVLTLPDDMTLEATGPDGALATFSASAVDAIDGSVAVSCDPASGSTFALGTETVLCSATDAAGNTGSATFTVTVKDTTAPAISGMPANQSYEATGPNGAVATWTAPTASDIVDGAVAVSCDPASASTFARGTKTVTCSVADAAGNSSSSSFTVTVVDTTPPVLTMPPNQSYEATSPSGATATWLVPTAQDIVDGSMAVTCSRGTGTTFALGTTTVNCSVADAAGNASAGTFAVAVVDTTAPVISSVTPSSATIWSPNHAMVPITVTVESSDIVSTPVCSIAGVTSSEPDNGLGDGDTGNDIQSVSGLTVSLRAERDGRRDGRIYTINVACADAAGNSTASSTTVTVPKSQGR